MLQWLLRRTNHTNIGIMFLFLTHATKRAITQKTEQLRLQGQRQFLYAVQQYRTAIGIFKKTDKLTVFIAPPKHFRFGIFPRNAGAIHCQKGMITAFTKIMARLCDHLFARTGITLNEQGSIQQSKLFRFLNHLLGNYYSA